MSLRPPVRKVYTCHCDIDYECTECESYKEDVREYYKYIDTLRWDDDQEELYILYIDTKDSTSIL